MKNILFVLTLLAPAAAESQTERKAIEAVLNAQVAAWNQGDVKAFMTGYDNSDSTTFVGSKITKGYTEVLQRYQRDYPTKDKMGTLSFSDLDIKLLGTDYASVIGKWHLERKADAGGNVGGIFTLLFEKKNGTWKIILDHTS
jgi:uncharacterized protein (TIGR02246 family)